MPAADDAKAGAAEDQAAEGQGARAASARPEAEAADPGTGPAGGGGQVDWEAKYREMRAHSREWEKKANENKSAAEELRKLREEQMTAEQKAAARAEELQRELDVYKRAEQRRSWSSAVSKETGVPSDVLELISADSEEELRERAEEVSRYFAKAPERQVVPGDGFRPRDDGRGETANEWLRKTMPR